MTEIEIKQLEDLIKDHIGTNKEVVRSKIEKLPPAGVGSIMLKVIVTVKPEGDSEEEDVHVVAKILPSSELTRKIFDVQNTYKVEIAFYDTILPILNKFREDNDQKPLDCFAKFYGARINLDGSEVVTDDCALILENLLVSGFKNGNRVDGLDLDSILLILQDLATFHGTTIAFRKKYPDAFRDKILPFCADLKSKNDDTDNEENYERMKEMIDTIRLTIEDNEKCKHLAELTPTSFSPRKLPVREPFAAISHCDLWTNNTMQKFKNDKPVANKLVDWQCYAYKSCVNDVIFLLFTSAKISVLQTQLDFLLQYYHKCLTGTLMNLKCDTSPFGYEKFLDEIVYENSVRREYGHVLFFISIVRREVAFGEKYFDEMEKMKNIKKDLNEIVRKSPMPLKEAIWTFMIEGEKRGWFPSS